MTWAELGRRLGVSRTVARSRYRRGTIERLERAGLLDNVDWAVLPPPVPPVAGTPGPDEARAWCRWCGQRIVLADEWRYTTGPDSKELAHPGSGLPSPDGEPHEAWPAGED